MTICLAVIQLKAKTHGGKKAPSTKDARILQGVALWCSFYRANPHRFAKDYLNIDLKLFQKMLLYMMNVSHYFIYIAARGQGKTFLIAIFCVIRCILYPGTRICIAAGSRPQSVNVLEKIRSILMSESPNLRAEIRNVVITQNDAYIDFHNGSVIKVVTANDRARGNRSNIIVIDEFRMVDRDIINTVLRKFNTTSRQPRYLHKPEYAHLQERNKEVYLSSAFYKSHWSFEKVKAFCKGMLDETKRYFVCGLPYQLSIREGLLSAEQVADEMSESDFNEMQWQMEMEALWFGDTDGSFFSFDTIVKNRRIQYPMIPEDLAPDMNDRKLRIAPKQPGEVRILSDDVALMSSKKNHNDASALFINQLVPTRTNTGTYPTSSIRSPQKARTPRIRHCGFAGCMRSLTVITSAWTARVWALGFMTPLCGISRIPIPGKYTRHCPAATIRKWRGGAMFRGRRR